MIALEIGGRLPYNVGINIFSCIISLIIYLSYKRNFADTHGIRLLRKIAVMILLVLLADTGMWVLDGRSGVLLRVLNYAVSLFFFIMEIAIVLQWLEYAWYRVFGKGMPEKERIIYTFLPFVILCLLVLTTPLTGWCFYLDDENRYHRGALASVFYAALLAYLALASAIALIQHRKETFTDRKHELQTIAFFAIPPLLGGTAQIIFFGFSLIWPCAVISSLLILLNKESQAISQDPLTGLNNRRSMEKHLRLYEEDQSRDVTLIMLDINDFKQINDQYGHSYGDMALIETADILRAVFGGTSAFLARYGGDEFVIILPQGKGSIAEETVRKVERSFEAFNKTKKFPFRLSVSAGYASALEKAANGTAALLKEADENMYRDKAQYYLKRASGGTPKSE